MTEKKLSLSTNHRSEVLLIRREVESLLAELGADEGLCHVWCPHTSAALTVNEGADPDVIHDFLGRLEKLVPWDDGYRHAEGNSAAHIKSILVGPAVVIPVSGGRLDLGTWQDIYFCEFDGPRQRRVSVRYLPTRIES